MTKREIAALAVKCLAIYAIVLAISQLSFVVSFTQGEWGLGRAFTLIIAFLPFVLLAMYGLILWLDADRLASRMAADDDGRTLATRASGAEIHAIAFSVVGLLVLTRAVPRLCMILISLVARGAETSWAASMTTHMWTQIGQFAVELALGLWLLFGAQGLVRLVRKIREPSWAKLHDETDDHEPEEHDDRPTHEPTEPDPDHDRPDAGGLPQ